MKIVSVKQNTNDWKMWRGKGIGASDAPTIMGDSPWSTPFQLWLEKTGQAEREEPNVYSLAAMQHGIKMEPEARAWYEAQQHCKFPTMSCEDDKYPFLRASLDGWNEEARVGIEIKCPGKVSHEKTKKTGRLPDNYKAQVQQQLLITGLYRIDFMSYRGPNDIIVIPVYPDKAYQENTLLPKLITFWQCVEFGIPPEIAKRDSQKALDLVKKSVDSLTRCVKVIEMLLSQNKEKKENK